MKARTILTALLLMLTTSIFATQRSAYCDYPTAHFDNEANGGLASLTITNTGNNTIALTIAPRADSDVVIDYLYVVVNGVAYIAGEDEGDILDEYTVEITFDEAPEEVTFSEIMWSNPDWGGRWMLTGITVPFDASCDVEATDEEDDNEEVTDNTTTDSSISQYCDYPTAHFDNEANGGLASLTITNIGNNTIALTMAPRADSDVIIDYLYTVVNGVGYSVGEDEGDILDEYTIEITFDEAPEEVTFSEIMWSNPDWGGRWMLQNITVPFNASCDGEGSTESGSTEDGEDTDIDDTTTTGATSEYCEYPTGHLNDPDFGDASSHILLTITKASENSTAITVAPRPDTAVEIDYLYVLINGIGYQVGTDEGDILDDYTVEVTFDEVPENVTISQIQWSTPGWEGRWAISDITVPFDASCDGEGSTEGGTTEDEDDNTDEQEYPAYIIIDNFEDGNCDGWGAQEGSNELSVVANPNTTGINTSDFVMCGGRSASSNNWAAAMISNLNITGGQYQYLHVMMYRDVLAGEPNAKMSDTVGNDIAPVAGQTMVTGEWQDVVFDMSDFTEGTTMDFLYYMYDRGELAEDAIVYIDDIVLNNDAEPRTATTEVLEEDEDDNTDDQVVYPDAYVIDDFEDGNCDGWGAQEGSNALSAIANPVPSGINKSDYVLCGGRSANSNNWAAAMITGLNIAGGQYQYLHVMMYRDVLAGEPNAKMSDTVGNDIAPVAGQTMVTGEWQDVVFDMSDFTEGTTMDFLYYMYDRGTLSEDAVVYLDNIELNNDAEPRVATDDDEDEVGDDIAPIMGAASIESISYTSVTLALSGTDKDNAGEATTITKFIINDADNGIVDKTVTVSGGVVTVSGLSVATQYYFAIRAQDNSGNISENGEDIMFQTLDVPETIVISDFEDGTHSWEGCEGSYELSVVDNPYVSGINTSTYALQGGRTTDANFWAAAMIRNLSIPGGYHNYLHVMMYRNTIATVPNAKLSDTYSTAFEPTNETLVTGEWQDLVFDISGTFVEGTTIDFLYFMYDIGTLEEDLICYLDNVELNNDSTPRTIDISDSTIETSTTATSVYGINGTIYVKSASPATVTIYTLTGSTVTTAKAVESGEYTLPSGCYIVRVGAEIYKVVI